jgi:TIR domain
MAVDAFISYSSKDKITADMACAALESAGVRCWIAPRDIRAGTEYAEGIIAAIDTCHVMVLIFSSNANASPQIHREIERAVSKGLTIIPFRIEDIAPTKAMEYYLGAIHWLDALTPPLAKHLGHLVEQVKANLQLDAAGGAKPARVFEQIVPNSAAAGDRSVASSPPARSVFAGTAQLALIAAVAILGTAVFFLWRSPPLPTSVPDHPPQPGPVASHMTGPERAPQPPPPIPAPTMAITKSGPFGGNGGAAFDDTDWNENRVQMSALGVIVNLNTGDTAQRIIGGLQRAVGREDRAGAWRQGAARPTCDRDQIRQGRENRPGRRLFTVLSLSVRPAAIMDRRPRNMDRHQGLFVRRQDGRARQSMRLGLRRSSPRLFRTLRELHRPDRLHQRQGKETPPPGGKCSR